MFTLAAGLCVPLVAACGPSMDHPSGGGGGSGSGASSDDSDSSTGSSASPGCPELVYEGDLLLESTADTEDLPLYTEVTGSVRVWAAGVQELSFLRCLAVVGSAPDAVGALSISSSPDLETLQGLERLERVDALGIGASERLRSLDGLQGLRRIGDAELPAWDPVIGRLSVKRSPALESINLPALEEVRRIEIGEYEVGEQISDEPTELLGTWECLPDGNPALQEIRFDALRRFNAIAIRGNQALESVDSLRSLAGATKATDDYPYPPTVLFGRNPNLPLSNIDATWSAMGDDAPMLTTCGNQGEDEICECFVGGE